MDNVQTTQLDNETKVKVKINKVEEKKEDEDYFYLKKFENKLGTLTERHTSKAGVTIYRIEFNDKEYGYFYRDDFHLLDGE